MAASAATATSGPVATILSTHTLYPATSAASSASSSRTRLAPADWLVQPFYTIRSLLFYRPPASSRSHDADQWMNASRMRAAFERVLASYLLLAGRLVAQADGTVEIEQHGDERDRGVPFIEASSKLRLADLPLSPDAYTSWSVLPSWLQLIPPFDSSQALSQPLVSLQHTRFACGGVCIGVHMHHYLADGESYFTLLRDWRQVYESMKGEDDGSDVAPLSVVPAPPCLDRSALHPRCSREEMLAEAAQFRQDAYTLPDTQAVSVAASSSRAAPAPATTAATPPPPCVHRVLRFTGPELERMRAAASDPHAGCTVPWVSTFEALSAHLMRCVHRARHPNLFQQDATGVDIRTQTQELDESDATVSATVAVSFRTRMDPLPPARLFANAVLKVCASIGSSSAHDDRTGLGATASAVHASIVGLDATAVRRALCWVSAAPNKSAIVLAERPRDKLSLNSWTRCGLYHPSGPTSLAFEADCPPLRVCFPHAAQGVNGLVTVFDTPADQCGTLEVHIGLLQDDMQRMIDGPLLRQFA